MIELNVNYDDETALKEYYPIIRSNLELIVSETERLDEVKLEEVPDGAVTTEKLANGAVGSEQIKEKAVTPEKLSKKYMGISNPTLVPDTETSGNYDAIVLAGMMSTSAGGKTAWTATPYFCTGKTEEDEYTWHTPRWEGDTIDGNDITDKSILPEKASFASYSTTPVRIGTWVDGTPVWRKAFDTTLTELDISDGVWGLPQLISGSGQRTKLKAIINSYVLTYPNNDYYSAIRMKEEEDGTCCRADSFCILTSRSKAGDIVRGYVDFVAEEDNVKFD